MSNVFYGFFLILPSMAAWLPFYSGVSQGNNCRINKGADGDFGCLSSCFPALFFGVKLVEMNWSPSARQLRQFGCVCLFALPLLGWIWSGNPQTIVWLLGIGAGLAVTGFFMPKALKPVFVGLMLIALPIGMVMTECLLLLIYFGLFLPIGLCFKIAKRDELKRSFEKSKKSYWEGKKAPKEAASYYRQW